MKNKLILFFLLLTASRLSFGQEVLSDLSSNPVLDTYGNKPGHSLYSSRKALADTLTLPLRDDFSAEGVYPSTSLWLDSNVYINDDYPLNQPTIGVATFDGLDRNGSPYEPNSPSAWGRADSLTSRPINLYNYVENSVTKLYTPSDKVFLSFYYQAEGLGNAPDPEDSLILEFRTPGKPWTLMRSFSADTADTVFHKVIVTITDTSFLKRGFQFRFRNNATLSGNLDHWHIDYVYMDKDSASNSYVKDVAFISRQKSMLKTYQSMPWSHYTTSEKTTSFSIRLRNLSGPAEQPSPISYEYGIFSPYVSTLTATPQMNPDSDTSLTYSFPFDFTPSGNTDDIQFEVKHVILPSPDVHLTNDTIRFFQRFSNYFAYDDGTAENGYGVNVVGAKIAYRFTLKDADTLRGLGIFFNRLINNLSERTFEITVWKSLNPEAPIYTTARITPVYDGINKFYFYRFDDPVPVSGTFFIGIRQFSGDILNIGFDRNTDAHSNLFYFSGDRWYSSGLKGTLMMRPYVGKYIPASVKENSLSEQIHIYPNPASQRVNVRLPEGTRNAVAEVFDLLGRQMIRENLKAGFLDVSELPQGIYFLKLKVGLSSTRAIKLIISRND